MTGGMKNFLAIFLFFVVVHEVLSRPRHNSTRVLTTRQTSAGSENTCRSDTIFLIDSSGSVRSVFSDQLEYVQHVVDTLDVGADHDRVAVVLFSGRSRNPVRHALSDPQDRERIQAKILALPYLGGITAVGAALDHAYGELEEHRRDDAYTTTNVVVVSDAFSYDTVDGPAAAIRALPGAQLFSVSIANASQTEMRLMAGNDDNMFDGFDTYGDLSQRLRECVGGKRPVEIEKKQQPDNGNQSTKTTENQKASKKDEKNKEEPKHKEDQKSQQSRKDKTEKSGDKSDGVNSDGKANKLKNEKTGKRKDEPKKAEKSEKANDIKKVAEETTKKDIIKTGGDVQKQNSIKVAVVTQKADAKNPQTENGNRSQQVVKGTNGTEKLSQDDKSKDSNKTENVNQVQNDEQIKGDNHKKKPIKKEKVEKSTEKGEGGGVQAADKTVNAVGVSTTTIQTVTSSNSVTSNILSIMVGTPERSNRYSTDIPSSTTVGQSAQSTVTSSNNALSTTKKSFITATELFKTTTVSVDVGGVNSMSGQPAVSEHRPLDVIILLDSSSSVKERFRSQLDQIARLLDALPSAPVASHVGVVKFGGINRTRIVVPLNNPLTNTEIKNQLYSRLQFLGGVTYANEALASAVDELNSSPPSRRAIKVVVLFSDGFIQDDINDELKSLYDADAKIFAATIAQGGVIHRRLLTKITGSPENIYTEENFNDLLDKLFELQKS